MKMFTADWCSYCKVAKKVIEDNNLDVELIDVDVEKGQVAASNLGIRALPTLVVGNDSYSGDACVAFLRGL